MANKLTISSVIAESVTNEQLQIVARWKDSEKRLISKENRHRAVILPANIWSETTGQFKENKALRAFMHDALEDLAKDYLSTIVEESNWLRVDVPQEDFSVSSLLTWQQEQAALKGRLNSDAIKAWVSQSFTVKAVADAKGKEVGKAFGETLVKLAGPSHGLTAENAKKILANLWKSEDADSLVGLKVQMRLEAISNKKSEENLLAELF